MLPAFVMPSNDSGASGPPTRRRKGADAPPGCIVRAPGPGPASRQVPQRRAVLPIGTQ